LNLYAIGYADVGMWWNYKNVTSPFTRLLYIKSGNAEVSFQSKTFKLESEDLIVVPPYTLVDYSCDASCGHYYVLFSSQLATGIELFSLNIKKWVLSSNNMTELYMKRLLELNPDLELKIVDPKKQAYKSTIIAKAEEIPGTPQQVIESDGILRMLFAPFVDTEPNSDAVINKGSFNRFIQVLDYIDKNIDKPISLKDMADEVSIHPNYFSDLFMKHIGERPISYLTKKRLEKVQVLLATTGRSVKDIAISSGFHDTDYFYRIFKKKVNLTPTQYRKNLL
jgi:YesN/AraC family two-component response regulator